MLEPGQLAPKALLDADVALRDGSTAAVGDLIAGRATVLVFLRHYGCAGCGQQVARLNPRLSELDALGISTVLIGNGTPSFMDGFVERHDLTEKKVTLVTDPELGAFAAAGLRHSWWASFGPVGLYGLLRAMGRGHQQYRGSGDHAQQGGVVFVDEAGTVLFYHRNRTLADFADDNDIVEAAMKHHIATAS